MAEVERRLGPVDILVNNNATNIGQGPALDVTDEALMKTIEVNVLSAVRLIRLTAPGMIARGGGVIMNIASISGIRPQPARRTWWTAGMREPKSSHGLPAPPRSGTIQVS